MPVKGKQSRGDVRLRGFFDRVSIEQAIAWIMAHGGRLGGEPIAVVEAAGRILAAPVASPSDSPPADRSVADGYALRSSETVGAGNYNPLVFTLEKSGGDLAQGSAELVHSGALLAKGADAILPFESAHVSAGSLEVIASVAEGTGIECQGLQVRAGAELIPDGRALRPADLGLLASFGIEHVRVVRSPRVRLVVCGPKGDENKGASGDANSVMLRALIARDGGVMETVICGLGDRSAMANAIATSEAEVVVVVGRSGTGPDDEAPLAISEVGELQIHGIALRPGDSAGLGTVGNSTIVLLPGDPLACFCAYEMLAGQLIRLLSGRKSELPYTTLEAEVGRKIVSTVGIVDLCRVHFVNGRIAPVGSVEVGGLASVARADGFVVIPAALEGYALGTRVAVHMFENQTGGISPNEI